VSHHQVENQNGCAKRVMPAVSSHAKIPGLLREPQAATVFLGNSADAVSFPVLRAPPHRDLSG
jgi:hypothetical protein